MTGILIALQAQAHTANTLAQRFEVSLRTIHRDVEELIQIGVPIESQRGRGGGFSLPRTWWLAPTNLTFDEVQTLLIALEHLGLKASHGLIEKLHAALQPTTLEQALADKSLPSVASDFQDPDPVTLRTLRRAIAEQSWVRLDYHGGSPPGHRCIMPLSLHIANGRWYVLAVDERRRESRQFRLDRIAQINRRLAPPDADFIIRAAMSAPDYHASNHPEIILDLTPQGVRFAKDHPDFRGHLTDNQISFRCPPSELGFYARELLRFGTDVTIIEPPELRSLVIQRSDSISAHHKEPSRCTE